MRHTAPEERCVCLIPRRLSLSSLSPSSCIICECVYFGSLLCASHVTSSLSRRAETHPLMRINFDRARVRVSGGRVVSRCQPKLATCKFRMTARARPFDAAALERKTRALPVSNFFTASKRTHSVVAFAEIRLGTVHQTNWILTKKFAEMKLFSLIRLLIAFEPYPIMVKRWDSERGLGWKHYRGIGTWTRSLLLKSSNPKKYINKISDNIWWFFERMRLWNY
jgi:hypothetical protein